MHCHWFILPLLLPTPIIWFSLDRKLQNHKRSQKKMETFWFFRLRLRHSYDCLRRLCIKVGRGQGDGDIGTRVWGLGDARRGTWGHQVWDVRTCGTGTRGRQIQGRGMWIIIAKVGGKCDIGHFPREYVLVKVTHIDLLRVPPCLFAKRRFGEDSLHWRKWNPCLVFLMEHWSPKHGRVGCGCQKLSKITAFYSK